MNKISAVYQIVNTVNGNRYVGSSRDVFHRWAQHKCPSTWKRYPNSLLYKEFQKYGVDKFRFQILAPVMPEYLRQVEQEFIELLNPTYNDIRSKGLTSKEYLREWRKSDKGKEYQRSDGYKESRKKYNNKLCIYNGEKLTLHALSQRFCTKGIKHPVLEAKKYLQGGIKDE